MHALRSAPRRSAWNGRDLHLRLRSLWQQRGSDANENSVNPRPQDRGSAFFTPPDTCAVSLATAADVRPRIPVSRVFLAFSPTLQNSYSVALAGANMLKQKTYGHFRKGLFQRTVA